MFACDVGCCLSVGFYLFCLCASLLLLHLPVWACVVVLTFGLVLLICFMISFVCVVLRLMIVVMLVFRVFVAPYDCVWVGFLLIYFVCWICFYFVCGCFS